MRLIDADRLKNTLIGLMNTSSPAPSDNDCAIDGMLNLLDEQPTVEAVKHGHWITQYDLDGYIAYYECTNCKFALLWGPDDDLPKYCPEFGAKNGG